MPVSSDLFLLASLPVTQDAFLLMCLGGWFGLGTIFYLAGGLLYDLTHPKGS